MSALPSAAPQSVAPPDTAPPSAAEHAASERVAAKLVTVERVAAEHAGRCRADSATAAARRVPRQFLTRGRCHGIIGPQHKIQTELRGGATAQVQEPDARRLKLTYSQESLSRSQAGAIESTDSKSRSPQAKKILRFHCQLQLLTLAAVLNKHFDEIIQESSTHVVQPAAGEENFEPSLSSWGKYEDARDLCRTTNRFHRQLLDLPTTQHCM